MVKVALEISCITKIDNILIGDAEDFNIAMPMYNPVECSKNYSKTPECLWNYYRDELNSDAENNINYSIKESKSFNLKTSITGNSEGNNTISKCWNWYTTKIFKQFLDLHSDWIQRDTKYHWYTTD